MSPLKTNINKVYAFSFFWMFLILMPVMVPFFLSLDLSMQNVFELQVIMGLTVVLLEVPSGYLSDLWGRKNTLIIGSITYMMAFNYLIYADNFWKLIPFEILVGISVSMVSGSDTSLLYDSIKLSNSERDDFTKAVGNVQFYRSLAESLGAIVGGFCASFAFKYAMYTHAAISWIPMLIAFTLVEPEIQRMDKKAHKENFKKVVVHIFKESKLLRYIYLNLVLWGLSTFVAVWIFQKYWMEEDIPLAYFGFLWALYNIVVGLTSKLAHRLEKRFGVVTMIWVISILPLVGYFGLSYLTGSLALVAGLTFQISRGLNQVMLKDAFNWRLPSEFRATANSVVSMGFRLSFAVVGPVTGVLIDKVGLRLTLMYLGLFFMFGLFFWSLPLVKQICRSN